MDTAYNNLPFESYLIINPDNVDYAKRVILGPWKEFSGISYIEDVFARIEENDEIDLYFNSQDPNARLYFSALECCPIIDRIQAEDGLVYCTPADEIIKLYRSNTIEFDALRVDTLQISVKCNSKTYVSYLDIIPKQLSPQEWEIMRDDLENEIRGLAQDIVRRNIGIGDEYSGKIPPSDLYTFLIISKKANAILAALLDIKDRPRYKLQKRYQEVDESENREIDTETVKQYLRKGGINNQLIVPQSEIVYDIPENRILKKIIMAFDEKLNRFISIIETTLRYHLQYSQKAITNHMYKAKYIEGLKVYLETAKKLRMISNVIKSAEWFREISNQQTTFIPHSFALDSRYGTLYRTYIEIKKQDFSVKLDPQYSYAWKKSSSLYEMWCYICVCRYFLQTYHMTANSKFDDIYIKNQLFPFLESGTKISMENDCAILEIVYDILLPKKSNVTKMYNNPFYMTGDHCRPDICINIYSKKSGWYIGSFVVECKYRKISSFWGNGTWSSQGQIRAYHDNSKSSLLLGGAVNKFMNYYAPRPVLQVIVFSPDDISGRRREDPDSKVHIKIFRPSPDQSYINSVCDAMLQDIDKVIEDADQTYISNANNK